MEIVYVLSGLAVGFVVGMTGVGGGSLMTPILLFFGINPATAVGTDLLYAAITKAGGVVVHQRQRNIDWKICGWLAAGSVPAAMATVAALHALRADTEVINAIIKHSLGVALMFTAVAIVFKKQLLGLAQRGGGAERTLHGGRRRFWATVLTGVLLGVIVTLSSIGAGAIGTIALFILFPLLPTARLVGTEIAHAVPLTLVAGLGHAGLGNIDWSLLGTLLVGSLPGIYLGSKLSGRMPDHVLRPILAAMLALVGAKLIF
ncbi:sulfite exporter TauE/SafE family protein [Chitinibacteraceae bacterium HSL-7]